MRAQPDFRLSYADINGTRIAYADEGNGPPLLLIHGSLCDCRYWNAQVKALSSQFRVIAPSLRFYWPEQWDGQGDGFSVSQHIADISALIAHLDIAPANLIGHSRGGRIALGVALAHADQVQSLTLADPGIGRPEASDQRGSFRSQANARIEAGQVDEGLSIFIDAVSGAGTWPRMVPWFQQMARENARTLLGQIREPALPVDMAAVAALTMPVLLIGGALSPAPYPATLDLLAQTLPDAQRVSIAGSSHGMNIGNPKAFNQAITTFLLG